MGIVAVEVVECVVVVERVGEQAFEHDNDEEADDDVEAAEGE